MSRRRRGAGRDVYRRATWFLIPVAVCLALAAVGLIFWFVFGDGRCR